MLYYIVEIVNSVQNRKRHEETRNKHQSQSIMYVIIFLVL